ncbi:enoyl-CoA hydratase [Verticiella sediminum]|uniref:Enoyl-CoA hydratase n=1 Tax=Verticiella sediminum TaxID=1247510 RepID=A0A556A7W9_9BURK|nr:enoyl-CoA hydratase [Verticiella sediminum]TSH88982.1 enoyl-CoA hydratase [Verticiella sediminum]
MSIATRTENRVAYIEIARPEKKNALTGAMYGALADAIEAAEADTDVRAMVLHGSRAIFTAGNDIQDFQAAGGERTGEPPSRRFMRALTGATKPVIAAVNGPAIGIGTTLLLHCDLVYLGEDAQLKMPFVSLGLCPEFGSSLVLPALAGHARAAEKLMLGDAIAPQEAVDMGIATRVLPADEVLDFARQQGERFAALPPEAVRTTKRLMRGPRHEAIWAQILVEFNDFGERLKSGEAQEAFAAFMERRKPDFSRF